MISQFKDEVFVDSADGQWLGDFHAGDGPFGPFGFVKCLGTAESCAGGRLTRFFNTPPCCTHGTHLPVPFAFGVQSMTTIPDDLSAVAAWNSAVIYAPGDIVIYSGGAYIAIWDVSPGNGNVNKQPDTNPLYWQPFDPTLPGSLSDASCLVELPGAAGCGFGWGGMQGVDGSAEWRNDAGALVADPGWHPTTGECWKFSCWAKAIDIGVGSDFVKRFLTDTYPTPDAALFFARSVPGFSYATLATFPLTMGDWVFCETQFNWTGGTPTWAYPLVMFSGHQLDQTIIVEDFFAGMPVDHPVRQPVGHVLVRDLHLYPCDQHVGHRLAHWQKPA